MNGDVIDKTRIICPYCGHKYNYPEEIITGINNGDVLKCCACDEVFKFSVILVKHYVTERVDMCLHCGENPVDDNAELCAECIAGLPLCPRCDRRPIVNEDIGLCHNCFEKHCGGVN